MSSRRLQNMSSRRLQDNSVFGSDPANFNQISNLDQIFILIFPIFLAPFLVKKKLFIGIRSILKKKRLKRSGLLKTYYLYY